MARYLRDERIRNITLDAKAVVSLFDVFSSRLRAMPEVVNKTEDRDIPAILSSTIRFDGKGYREFYRGDLLEHFENASRVERIVFELGSIAAIQTNRGSGSFMDLRLDEEENSCWLTVSSDDENWASGSFIAVKEVLQRHKNQNYLIRNDWVGLAIQLTGLLLGFLVSLWGASRIAPSLTIDNAFLISFLLVLLVFMSLLGQVTHRLRIFVYRTFPSIRFYRPSKDKLQWLRQAVISGILIAIALYALNFAFRWAGKLLGPFVSGG